MLGGYLALQRAAEEAKEIFERFTMAYKALREIDPNHPLLSLMETRGTSKLSFRPTKEYDQKYGFGETHLAELLIGEGRFTGLDRYVSDLEEVIKLKLSEIPQRK